MNLRAFAMWLIASSLFMTAMETIYFGGNSFWPRSDMEMLCDLIAGMPGFVGASILLAEK